MKNIIFMKYVGIKDKIENVSFAFIFPNHKLSKSLGIENHVKLAENLISSLLIWSVPNIFRFKIFRSFRDQVI